MTLDEYKLLRKINSPRDLKQLSAEELRTYCDELRSYIIDECSVNPGHLASSLGCVELAAALHYVFDTPADKIVWDVGHQTYAHKIITGRREAFKTKRLLGGISGFPRMSESPYDAFGGGHASVSISAAFGYNKYYFSKLFNRYIGENMSSYINLVRLQQMMKKAKRKSDVNITELAYECGFDSLSTFYRYFKKVYGINPTEALKENK